MIVKTDNQYYSNIASAIREKNETNIKYKPSEMAIAIENIENGGISCTLSISTVPNATVTATLSGTTVSAKADVSGIATLELPEEGVWAVTATVDGKSVSIQVNTAFSIKTTLQFFPAEPSSYEYMALVTASQTWTAPEDGYFQIEVFGASGHGGLTYCDHGINLKYNCATGGGGGGGGYACSRVKMNKGDTIALTVGATGSTTSAAINSSLETYSSPQVTSGKIGTSAQDQYDPGTGGAGGVGSGGNYSNANGSAGSNGGDNLVKLSQLSQVGIGYVLGGAGANGAPDGGNSRRATGAGSYNDTGRAGSAGFIKIYRGNTNIA